MNDYQDHPLFCALSRTYNLNIALATRVIAEQEQAAKYLQWCAWLMMAVACGSFIAGFFLFLVAYCITKDWTMYIYPFALFLISVWAFSWFFLNSKQILRIDTFLAEAADVKEKLKQETLTVDNIDLLIGQDVDLSKLTPVRLRWWF